MGGLGGEGVPRSSFRYDPTFQKINATFFGHFFGWQTEDGRPLLQKILDLPLLKAPFTLSELN